MYQPGTVLRLVHHLRLLRLETLEEHQPLGSCLSSPVISSRQISWLVLEKMSEEIETSSFWSIFFADFEAGFETPYSVWKTSDLSAWNSSEVERLAGFC